MMGLRPRVTGRSRCEAQAGQDVRHSADWHGHPVPSRQTICAVFLFSVDPLSFDGLSRVCKHDENARVQTFSCTWLVTPCAKALWVASADKMAWR